MGRCKERSGGSLIFQLGLFPLSASFSSSSFFFFNSLFSPLTLQSLGSLKHPGYWKTSVIAFRLKEVGELTLGVPFTWILEVCYSI